MGSRSSAGSEGDGANATPIRAMSGPSSQRDDGKRGPSTRCDDQDVAKRSRFSRPGLLPQPTEWPYTSVSILTPMVVPFRGLNMSGKSVLFVMMTASILASGVIVQAGVVIDTVTVGNPGNPNDTHGDGYGRVDYVYNIGMFEVTARQYTEFLNAVAATDTYGLYNTRMDYDADSGYEGCNIKRSGSQRTYTYSVPEDWGNRPVNYVSWGDAARFCNWLHNGQPGLDTPVPQDDNSTEDGSYFLNGAISNAELLAVTREPDATWVIPSENEWYKAAYHLNDGPTGNYFNYPTSCCVPSNDLISPDPGNNANFYVADGDFTIGSPYYRTEVGDFENSESPYGTFDQGGNVSEWNEAVRYGSNRGVRGGSFDHSGSSLNAVGRASRSPTSGQMFNGFRVAEVPEPATIVLLGLGSLVVARRRKR